MTHKICTTCNYLRPSDYFVGLFCKLCHAKLRRDKRSTKKAGTHLGPNADNDLYNLFLLEGLEPGEPVLLVSPGETDLHKTIKAVFWELEDPSLYFECALEDKTRIKFLKRTLISVCNQYAMMDFDFKAKKS